MFFAKEIFELALQIIWDAGVAEVIFFVSRGSKCDQCNNKSDKSAAELKVGPRTGRSHRSRSLGSRSLGSGRSYTYGRVKGFSVLFCDFVKRAPPQHC
jgi:hypothetical protein